METSVTNSTGKNHHPSFHDRKHDFYGVGRKPCFSAVHRPLVRPAVPSGSGGAAAVSSGAVQSWSKSSTTTAGQRGDCALK